MHGEIGDSIYKEANSLFVYVYRKNKLKFISRISSYTCDSILDPSLKGKVLPIEHISEEELELLNLNTIKHSNKKLNTN